MNKLFTKVAALTLGVAMAAGVGVALGSANASEAKAADDIVITFPGSPSKYTNSYTDSFSISSGNISFTFANWNNGLESNAWDAIRGVRKNAAWTGTITSGVISSKVESIVVNVTQGSSNLTETKLEVASDSGFTTNVQTISLTADATTGEKTYTVPNTVENSYYRISHTASSASGNGGLRIDRVTVNYESATPTTQYTVTDSVENASVSPLKVNEGATLTATITPDTGYNLPETVSVTMGGTAATHTYENGVVTVENVTGDIVISGTCGKVHGQWEDDPYTISEAVAAITGSGVVNNVYVGGIVSQVDSYNSTYKSVTFWISADGTTTDQFEVYGCLKREGSFSSKDDIEVGATVLVKGNIKSFTQGGTTIYEFDKNCVLWTYEAPVHTDPTISLSSSKLEFVVGDEAQEITVSSDQFTAEPVITVEGEPQYVSCQVSGNKVTVSPVAAGSETVTIKGTNGNEADTAELTVVVYPAHGHKDSDPYTVAEAKAKLDAGAVAEKVYVSGIITEIVKMGDKGGITYWISDDGASNEFEIFYGNNLNNEPFENLTDIEVGASIINYGNITLYQSTTYEFTTGSYLVSYHAPAPTLESIAVSGKYKTEYGYQAEEFDKEGIVVTATYSDQSQQTVDLTDVEFSGYNKSVLGEQTVTVTYQEKTTTFKVTVYYTATYKPGEGTSEDGDYVEYIKNPDNYELVSFEKTGFVAPTGKQFKEWSQGTTGKSVQANGNLNFTAVYEDIPVAKYSVTYTAGQGTGENHVVPDVEAGSLHALVTFETAGFTAPEGQQFKGWQVGNDAELRDAGYEVTVNGDVTVTAIYEAKDWSDAQKDAMTTNVGLVLPYLGDDIAAAFTLNDSDPEDVYFEGEVDGNQLSSIYTAFNSAQWDYVWMNEENYNYFFTNPCSTGTAVFQCGAYKDSNDAIHTFFYYYFSFYRGIIETHASIEAYVGDSVSDLELELALVNTEMQGSLISAANCEFSVDKFEEAGEVTVYVYFNYFYGSFKVNVKAVEATGLEIDTSNVKLSYEIGEEFDPTGLVATLKFNNGSTQDVSADVELSGFDSETAGEKTITVAYGDFSQEFTVTVNEPAPVYDADAFAKDLLEMVAPICENYDGKKNNKVALKSVWDTMSQRYSTLSDDEKAKVIAAAAKTDGTDLEKAMAFYNYACKKYGLTKFIEGRQVKALVTEHETGNSILPIVVIVASSVAAITAIGVVIALKRRKALLAK